VSLAALGNCPILGCSGAIRLEAARGLMRTDTELFEASKHVEYEVNQINDCIARLTLYEFPKEELAVHNSLLTAFTVYTRNLYQFFYTASPRPDDIIASEYFDDPLFWKTHRPPPNAILIESSQRANKLSAHLTYERVKLSSNYWWKWREIHYSIRNTLKVFVANVPPQRIVDLLQNFEQQWTWNDRIPPP
jgi:hypothetical protein